MKVLVIAAHPDDEILGCGGTIARHTAKGDDVYVLIMSEGVSAQYEDKEKFLKLRRDACLKATKYLGVKEVFFDEFPDGKLDSISQLEINKKIEGVIAKVNPQRVYTHHHGDLNKDHRIVHDSTLIATRRNVQEVFSYEILGSTNKCADNKEMIFVPNYYVSIDKYLDKKLKALSFYETEVKNFPNPVSEEAIKVLAKHRGVESGLNAAEAFVCIKKIEE